MAEPTATVWVGAQGEGSPSPRGPGSGTADPSRGAGLGCWQHPHPPLPPEHRRSPSVTPPERGVCGRGLGFGGFPLQDVIPFLCAWFVARCTLHPCHLCWRGSQLSVGTAAGPWRAKALVLGGYLGPQVRSWARVYLWTPGQAPSHVSP